MSKHKLNFVIIVLFAALLASCNPMKKNTMKDRADDVKESIIVKTDNGAFLIIKEEIFQAVSKSDNGGFRRISGYTEERISSYDLNTGALIKRIALGEIRENNCLFLGYANGKLWYKSIDKDIGFHARDPKSLEIIVNEEKITEVNPVLKNNLSQPEWSALQRFYGFDSYKNMPMVSDNEGYVYYVDPVSLKAEKSQESIKNFVSANSCLSTSMNIDVNTSINLSGNPRNNLNYFNNDVKEPSFLKGEFLKCSNELSSIQINSSYFDKNKSEIENYKKEIDSLQNILNSIDTTSDERKNKITLKYKTSGTASKIKYLNDRIKYANDNLKRYSDDKFYDIITNDNCVFILSQSDVTDKAKCIISKVKLNADSTVSLKWQTELADFFRNPDKGFDKSSFEMVFSKGNPDLNTMRVIENGEKLVFIFMLKTVCLDISTGKILWSIDL